MCGICGFVSKKKSPSDIRTIVETMTASMTHRGPDEDGFCFNNEVGMGMRRLKVIDLATGKQPIYNEAGTIGVVFNGEIYNYQELYAELKAKGHTFSTVSDTEVLVHSYEEYGAKLLDRLNGMFAFCILDKSKGELFIARDRVGIKPLYYTCSDQFFAFASEMKSLLTIPELDKQLDIEALNEYMTFEYSLAPKTVVKAIRKLPPAHFIRFSGTGVAIERYWDVTFEQQSIAIDDIKQKLFTTLSASVKRRLISDVPLGAFLSGGIDSSIMVALMAQHADRPVKTFSIGFKNQSYNELSYARIVAKRYNTEHHEAILDDDFLDVLDTCVGFIDEPMADVSIFPTYLVSREARKNVTVALSGDGGDELFGGYDTYLAQKYARAFFDRMPGMLRTGVLPALLNHIPPTRKKKGMINRIKRFVEGANHDRELMHYRWMTFLNPQGRAELFADYSSVCDCEKTISVLLDKYKQWGTDNQMMLTDFSAYMVEDILTKVDRMSMAVSLEARVPYLDHTVVDLAYRIPGALKIKGSETKHILKETFGHLLPEDIMRRGKEGFSIPLKNWLRDELKTNMQDVLNKEDIHALGIFNYDFITQRMHEHSRGSHNHAHTLWPLMLFMMWWKRYIT